LLIEGVFFLNFSNLVHLIILNHIIMNIVQRAKGIILKPKEEWEKISQENNSHSTILINYLIPLALIPAIASLIGYGLIGYGPFSSLSFGIKHAIIMLVSTIGGAYLTAFIIDILAPSFGAEKNYDKAFALVVFAYTPQLVAGVFYILPVLGVLALLAGLYGLYVLYLGIKPMMKSPDDKVTVYFIVSLVVVIVVYFVLSSILTSIFIGSVFRAAAGF